MTSFQYPTSSLRNRLVQTRNVNGDSATHLLCSLLLLLLLHQRKIQSPSSLVRVRSISISSTNHSSSFVVSYLMNSCGLSEDKAISVSKELHFETSSKPATVLTLLENNGFTKPYVSKLIRKQPSVLSSSPYKTLKPKIEFFNSIGLSGLDFAKFFVNDPTILLKRSLEKQIIPIFAFLKSIVHTDKNVISILKRSSRVLKQLPGTNLVPNIGVLRDVGVPESNISRLLLTQPSSLLKNADRFKKIVKEIKGMGLDPLKSVFVIAIDGLTSMSKLTWEAKFNVYRRWGWSEDDIRTAFRKQPKCMMASEKKIMAAMDFLVNQMGFSPLIFTKHPMTPMYSMEKRIIPRCSVIRVLVSKGLVKKDFYISTVMVLTEKPFLKKYVIKYEQEVPELLKVYQGQLDCLKLLNSSEGIGGMSML